MNSARPDEPATPSEAVAAVRMAVREPAAAFVAEHQAAIDRYRVEVTRGLQEALAALRGEAQQRTNGDPLVGSLLAETGDYVDWMQWSLWDLPPLAAILEPEPARFRQATSACAFVYLSFRILDDFLDRHYLYRGKRSTLLATFTQSHGGGQVSEGLTVLAAMLLCLDGMARLNRLAPGSAAAASLERALQAARGTTLGMIFERSTGREWSRDAYERLVELKNVEYWRILDAALDPERASPLQPFLERYYALAQRLNDAQDHSADDARGQPNLVTILGRDRAEVERVLAADVVDLWKIASALPVRERGLAALKLGESIDEAMRLGLFRTDAPAAPAAAATAPLGLVWDAEAEAVLERLGADAVEDVACSVCGGRERRTMFRKQGFAYHRCTACTHVFVSPRVRPDIQARVAEELDGLFEDPFLDVQRIQAEHLCRVLRRSARGPRLLDIGFGQGYLMQLAPAFGFEVYGVDSSAALVDRLRPQFGRRLERQSVAEGALPWSGFDVVVMSHVLEHLAAPAAAVRAVRNVLNADGLFAVMVPDIESIQFQIFGKRWDAVSPIAHPQCFTEASLRKLVEDAGFTVVSRLDPRPEPGAVATAATRLFRSLGGTEQGELGLLCRPTAAEGAA